jgi:hypothetical protein
MAQITRSTKIGGGTTLSSNTLARAADVETDALTLFNAHNNHDSGSSKWTAVSAEGTSATVGIFNNSSGTNDILDCRDNGSSVFKIADGGTITATGSITIPTATITTLAYAALGYRRPNLVFVSSTAVDVENNTGTANQTTIVFPDGSIRSVTENTSSTNKYRRFLITAAAEFTSGTEDSGVRSGISEATDTWYAIYAVKSAINSANFVLAGDTTLPLQANYSTLNTRYGGANSWVYLGMIRNGDNSGATGDILTFNQQGPSTFLSNVCTANVIAHNGLRLASTAGATSLTYTYSAGTGTTDIPNHVSQVELYWANAADSTNALTIRNSANTYALWSGSGASQRAAGTLGMYIQNGLLLSSAGSIARDIALIGWNDPLLVGSFSVL